MISDADGLVGDTSLVRSEHVFEESHFMEDALPTVNVVCGVSLAQEGLLTPSLTKSSLRCRRSPTASLRSMERTGMSSGMDE